MCAMIKAYIDNDGVFPEDLVIRDLDEYLIIYNAMILNHREESRKFNYYLSALGVMASEFELIKRLNRSAMANFRFNDKVVESLEHLYNLFADNIIVDADVP